MGIHPKCLVRARGARTVWAMLKNCVRCGGPAGALMVYDYAERAVWLEDLMTTDRMIAGHPFCADHANRLTPPLGWTLTDRRTLSRLFAPLEVA